MRVHGPVGFSDNGSMSIWTAVLLTGMPTSFARSNIDTNYWSVGVCETRFN